MPIRDRSEEIRRKPSYRAAVWLQRLTFAWGLGWICAVAIPRLNGLVVFLTWLPGALLALSTLTLVRLAGVRFEVFATERRWTWPLEKEMGQQFYRDVFRPFRK